MLCRRHACAALLLLIAACPVMAADDSRADDEKLLKDAGIATDDAGLLAFLRDHSLDDDGRKQIEVLIRNLGNDEFDEREKAVKALIACGPLAASFLRDASKNADPEVSRRAREALDAIERGPGLALPTAVVRTLARRKTPGAVEILLRFVAFADDELLEDETLAALAIVGLRDGKPDDMVKKAATDTVNMRRAAAGYVLGRARDRTAALQLLEDPEPCVRFRTAQGLLSGRDRRAVPALIALLAEAPPQIMWRVEDLLLRLAGEKAPPSGSDTDRNRAKWRDDWAAWWAKDGAMVDLATVDERPAFLNLLLVPEMHGGRVFEVDRSNKVLYQGPQPAA